MFESRLVMTTNKDISDLIKATAVKYITDAEVMLFGSRARDEADAESDYDILIITGKKLTAGDKILLRTKIRKELLGKGIRSDILIQNNEEIERKKRLPGHLIRNILKEAIIL